MDFSDYLVKCCAIIKNVRIVNPRRITDNYNISTPILKSQIINDLRGKNGKLLRNSKQKLK
jgi:hypothetical protein